MTLKKSSTKVGATSGQGVSRRSYQVARSLGAKGSGASGLNPLRNVPAGQGTPGVASGARDYAKTSGMVSAEYSEREMANPNLKTINSLPSNKTKAAKGFTL